MSRYTVLSLYLAAAVLNCRVFGSPLTDTIIGKDIVIEPEDTFGRAELPSFAVDDGWKDWESWQASPDVIEAFPFYKMGYDMDGLAAYVVEFGKWNYRKWAEQSPKKVEEFWVYHEQIVRRQEKDAALNDGQGVVQIIDWDGFSLTHHASPDAIKLAIKMFAAMLRINESVKYGFYVNVNFSAETFIHAMTPFVGVMLEKFEICGTIMPKCTQMMVKTINADQLAPKYGGSSSDWTPIPFVG